MFALPLTASLPSTLASHVFGRFASSSAPSAMPAMAAQASGGAGSLQLRDAAVDLDDDEFDLAQRVREVGEW